jgi:hypothetical protein
MDASDRKARLEARMTALVGANVELTVRGARAFTFSTEAVTPTLGDVIAAFFGNLATVTTDHDEEIGSFAFVEVAA